MTHETVQVYSGTPVTAEELLVLAEFAAPSHFVSEEHLDEAAENLAEWTDHQSATVTAALRLAVAPGRATQRDRAALGDGDPVLRAAAGARPTLRPLAQSARPPPSSMNVWPVT